MTVSETSKRTLTVRLHAGERETLQKALPPGQELAAWCRETLLAVARSPWDAELRRMVALIIAALSDSITFEQALTLFDQYVLGIIAGPAQDAQAEGSS